MPAVPLTAGGKPVEMAWVKDSCGRQAAYYSGMHLHAVSKDKALLLGAVQSCVCSLPPSLLGMQWITFQSVHMHHRYVSRSPQACLPPGWEASRKPKPGVQRLHALNI